MQKLCCGNLRIYNENYKGRMRDWAILNACWPKSRCDILGFVYKVFAHFVNMLFVPISSKEAAQQQGLITVLIPWMS